VIDELESKTIALDSGEKSCLDPPDPSHTHSTPCELESLREQVNLFKYFNFTEVNVNYEQYQLLNSLLI